MSDAQEHLPHHSSPVSLRQQNLSLLRASMRERRRSVASEIRREASLRLARRIIDQQLISADRRIAVYNAIDGEIDLSPLVRYAQSVGCALYAPRIVDMQSRKM